MAGNRQSCYYQKFNIYDPQEEAEGLTLDSSALGAPSMSSGYMNVPVYDVELAAGYQGFYDHDHESESMSVSLDCLEKNNVSSDSASIVTVRGSSYGKYFVRRRHCIDRPFNN